MNSPLKIAFSLFLGIAIVLIFHKAVAAPQSPAELTEVPSLQFVQRSAAAVSCGAIASSMIDLKTRILDDSQRLSAYLLQASTLYLQWHATLGAQENRQTNWPRRYFHALNVSSDHLDSSASSLGAAGSQYQKELSQLKDALSQCYVENAELDQELSDLNEFTHNVLENQSVAANYVEQMQSNLSDRTDDWRSYEGHQIAVPAGTFSPLQNDANSLAEAGGLLRDDGEILASQIQPIVAHLLGLTPKGSPNKMVAAPLSRL